MVTTIFFVLAMAAIDSFGIGIYFNFPYQSLISFLIFILGVVVIGVGGSQFRKAKTTVNPLDPDKTTMLVTNGIYSLSRNPMYIGFLLWLLGCAFFFGNFINFLLMPAFVIIVNKLYITPEEKSLEKLFKIEFVEYKNRVNRWL